MGGLPFLEQKMEEWIGVWEQAVLGRMGLEGMKERKLHLGYKIKKEKKEECPERPSHKSLKVKPSRGVRMLDIQELWIV